VKTADRKAVIEYLTRQRPFVLEQVSSSSARPAPGLADGDLVWWNPDEPDMVGLIRGPQGREPEKLPLAIHFLARNAASGEWADARVGEAIVDDHGNVYVRRGEHGVLKIVWWRRLYDD
jgi:hypothetical protein